jgi:hypothetical protein
VDVKGCFRTLPDDVIPWAAPPLNSHGLHIEICGYARWSKAQWHEAITAIDHAAKAAARWCADYDIPVAFITAKGLRSGRPGITSHRNVSLAFGKSDHTDPGGGFPYWGFMSLVRHYYAEAVDLLV